MAIRGKGINFGVLAEHAGARKVLAAKSSLDVSFTGCGVSLAAIAGSLDGVFKLLVGKGRIKAQTLDVAVGGLATVLGSMFAKRFRVDDAELRGELNGLCQVNRNQQDLVRRHRGIDCDRRRQDRFC